MTIPKVKVISATEYLSKPVPDISYFWGDLLRTKGRLALIGAPKTAKSFFVLQLAMHIATGTPFLGMDTKESVVLYVNFEVSGEKLHERLQDLSTRLDIPHPDKLLVVSPGGLSLETQEGKSVLEAYIIAAREQAGQPGVLILDPRRQAMGGDENQSETLNSWCKSVDELRTEYDLGLVVVHHKGKGTTGAGRGSSVFDAWLDTMLWLEPPYDGQEMAGEHVQPDLSQVTLAILGRDTDHRELTLEFQYPVWNVTDKQEAADQGKVAKAVDNILGRLGEGQLRLSDLRLQALSNHSEYAFKTALKRLVVGGRIEVAQDMGKQGNWKIVRLTPPSE